MRTAHKSPLVGVAALARIRTMERVAVVRMTRSLRGVPAPHKEPFYAIRKGRPRRLMGDFPERALDLVERGAEPNDVLCFTHALERLLLQCRIATHRITLADAQRDEERANSDTNVAQYAYALAPTIEHQHVLLDALEQQRLASLTLALVVERDAQAKKKTPPVAADGALQPTPKHTWERGR